MHALPNTDGRCQVEELGQSAKAIGSREGALQQTENEAEGEVLKKSLHVLAPESRAVKKVNETKV